MSFSQSTSTHSPLVSENTLTNACYKFVFDKSFKQLKNFYDCKTIEGLRNFVPHDKLDAVANLEQKIAVWIEDFDLTKKQVKEKSVELKKKQK